MIGYFQNHPAQSLALTRDTVLCWCLCSILSSTDAFSYCLLIVKLTVHPPSQSRNESSCSKVLETLKPEHSGMTAYDCKVSREVLSQLSHKVTRRKVNQAGQI